MTTHILRMYTTGGHGHEWFDWAGGLMLTPSRVLFPEQIIAYAEMLEALACRDIGVAGNKLPPALTPHWQVTERWQAEQ